MSVTSLLTSAQYRFGQGPENIRFQDDFYSALNNAQNDFSISRSWGFLRTSANLTATHASRTTALPTGFGKMYDVPNALVITSPTANSGDLVELMPVEQWQADYWDDGTEEGTPTYAYILGSSIYWSPIPDADYTVAILYYKIPTTIADSSTGITIPDVYGEVLQKMIYRRLQDAGYSSVQELQISDADIAALMNKAARDDVRRYGGMTMNLASSTYTRRTV
jgi:hypothetical protein